MADDQATTAVDPAQPNFVLEKHSIDFVPEDERHGRARGLFPMWFGANCMIVTITTGALAVLTGFSLVWAGVAIVVGLLFGGIFMAYHSAQGPQLGLPQMIQSRAQFGFYGANLPMLVVILMYLGFFASGGVLGGEALAGIFHFPTGVGIVLVSIGNVALVIFGYRLIHIIERTTTVAGVIIFALFSIDLAVSAPHGGPPAVGAHPGFQAAPFILTVALTAIWLISYAPYVADYSRYLPSRTRIAPTFWYTYGGAVLASIWMMVIGMLLQNRYPKLGVVGQIQHVAGAWGTAFEVIVLLVIVLGIIGINALNLYGSFMSALTITTSYWHGWKPTRALRAEFIIPLAIIGTYGAFVEEGNFLDSYENFLTFLMYFLIPWTAVNLADFYLVRHGDYQVEDMFKPHGRYGRIGWAGMISYLIGCLAQVPFANVAFFEGPLARAMGGADLTWIVGIVISGACYLALTRGTAREGRHDVVPATQSQPAHD